MSVGVITGSIFVEKIFRIPGLGCYFVNSIYRRDYPLEMALIILLVFLLATAYLLVDIFYTFVDPRVKLIEEKG